MRGVLSLIDTGSRAVAYSLGGGVIVLAVAVMTTSIPAEALLARAGEVAGPAFLTLMAVLVLTSVFSWIKVMRDGGPEERHRPWLEAGLQASNGVATLALTYTLLGISLGIGGLSDQELTPQTVQLVIKDLTASFSMAFMTTVIGLPTAAVLRTLLTVTHARVVGRPHALCAVVPPEAALSEGDRT